jgi:lipoprotein-anchoring transpeptidase ErfK/SrfK
MRWGFLPAVLLLAALVAPTAQGRLTAGQGCPGEQRLGDSTVAYAAAAKGTVDALSAPGGRPVHTFTRKNENGVRTVFGVLAAVTGGDCEPFWYRVQLPIRPNGATGYVRAAAVNVYSVRARIEIDLSSRRLSLYRGGKLVLTATAGIGAADTPTPMGRYYVNQRFRTTDPGGPFGPGAIGISAFSPTLTDWAQGGPIAVHGTNDPSSIGRLASHGCIRIENRAFRRVLFATATGAPVVIHS